MRVIDASPIVPLLSTFSSSGSSSNGCYKLAQQNLVAHRVYDEGRRCVSFVGPRLLVETLVNHRKDIGHTACPPLNSHSALQHQLPEACIPFFLFLRFSLFVFFLPRRFSLFTALGLGSSPFGPSTLYSLSRIVSRLFFYFYFFSTPSQPCPAVPIGGAFFFSHRSFATGITRIHREAYEGDALSLGLQCISRSPYRRAENSITA